MGLQQDAENVVLSTCQILPNLARPNILNISTILSDHAENILNIPNILN
jgi:hypothetical protein